MSSGGLAEPEPRNKKLSKDEESSQQEVAIASSSEVTGFLLRQQSVADIHALEKQLHLPLVDVAQGVAAFTFQSQVLDELGLPHPLIWTSEVPIPVSLRLDEFDGPPTEASIVNQRGRMAKVLGRSGTPFEEGDRHTVWSAFTERLGRFVDRRVGRGEPGEEATTAAGLNFRVNTDLPGYQIHYSPAYFFDSRPAFGNTLSTPVDGPLDPGIYIFGGRDATMTEPAFDFTEYEVPPSSVAHLFL